MLQSLSVLRLKTSFGTGCLSLTNRFQPNMFLIQMQKGINSRLQTELRLMLDIQIFINSDSISFMKKSVVDLQYINTDTSIAPIVTSTDKLIVLKTQGTKVDKKKNVERIDNLYQKASFSLR